MTEHTPFIDFQSLPAPHEGFLVTEFNHLANAEPTNRTRAIA